MYQGSCHHHEDITVVDFQIFQIHYNCCSKVKVLHFTGERWENIVRSLNKIIAHKAKILDEEFSIDW